MQEKSQNDSKVWDLSWENGVACGKVGEEWVRWGAKSGGAAFLQVGTVDVSFLVWTLGTRLREAGTRSRAGARPGGKGRGLRLPGWRRRRRLEPWSTGSRGVSPCTSAGVSAADARTGNCTCASCLACGASRVVLTEHVAAAELDEGGRGRGSGACGAGGREKAQAEPLPRRTTARGSDRVRPTWAPTPRIQLLS